MMQCLADLDGWLRPVEIKFGSAAKVCGSNTNKSDDFSAPQVTPKVKELCAMSYHTLCVTISFSQRRRYMSCLALNGFFLCCAVLRLPQ